MKKPSINLPKPKLKFLKLNLGLGGKFKNVDQAKLVSVARSALIIIVVAGVALFVGIFAVRFWAERQNNQLAAASEQLEEVAASVPTPTSTPVPSPTPLPSPTPMPTVTSEVSALQVQVVADMQMIPEGPGPVSVPIRLTVRSAGDPLGAALDVQLTGEGGVFFQGDSSWHTDGSDVAWEIVSEVLIDPQRKGSLAWWILPQGGEAALATVPLEWQGAQSETARAEAVFTLE
jgi:hypothetical protein